MNRTSFVTESGPRASIIVGSRVKFNDKSIVMFMNNLDAKTAKKMTDMRGEIVELQDSERCVVKWDGSFYMQQSKEFLRDLEDEKA